MKKSIAYALLLAGVIVGSSVQIVEAGQRPAKHGFRALGQPLGDGYDDGYESDDDRTTIAHKTIRGRQSWLGLRGASLLTIAVWFLAEWEKVKDPYYEKHPELVTEGMGKLEKLKQSYGILEIWKAFFARNWHNLTLGMTGEKGSTTVLSVVLTYAALFNVTNQVNQFKLHGVRAKSK